jgi:hypothetical protein
VFFCVKGDDLVFFNFHVIFMLFVMCNSTRIACPRYLFFQERSKEKGVVRQGLTMTILNCSAGQKIALRCYVTRLSTGVALNFCLCSCTISGCKRVNFFALCIYIKRMTTALMRHYGLCCNATMISFFWLLYIVIFRCC